jgi:DNA-binding response OmpR family regulator
MTKLLVVDDDELICKWFKDVFEERGFSVRTASNGMEAVDILREASFDVLIIDIVMPKKGGLETVMELRHEHADIPLILMSGKVQVDSDVLTRLAGQYRAEQVLKKPLELKKVLTAVNKALEKR